MLTVDWMLLALGERAIRALDIGFGDYTVNPTDLVAASSPSKKWKPPTKLPTTKRLSGRFDGNYAFHIDTKDVQEAEDKFHIHIHDPKGKEIAKIDGFGRWINHRGQTLARPSEVPRWLRAQINRLVRWAAKEMRDR